MSNITNQLYNNRKVYFVLRGPEYQISLMEVKALINICSNEEHEIRYINGVAITNKDFDYGKFCYRMSHIKYLGRILTIKTDIVEVKEIISDFRNEYSIIPNKIGNYPSEDLSHLFYLNKKSDKVIDVIFTEGKFIVGERICNRNNESFSRTSPKNRKYHMSGTMDSYTSRLLVNLSRAERHVFDPACGTGSILIEGCQVGLELIGSDIELKYSVMAKENLESLGCKNYNLLNADSALVYFREGSIKAISSDLPYGRSTRIKGSISNLKDFYENFFSSSYTILKKGGFISFACDIRIKDIVIDILERSGIKLHEASKAYVHKSLSRFIVVGKKLG